jgi:hypothetical protein
MIGLKLGNRSAQLGIRNMPTRAFKADLEAFMGLAMREADRYVFGNQ